mmetsp:Transcript_3416/g.9720  ORF Transcript_3416/g.9720 Transcript_3416/m.9720 type:complete len:172 (+) Transcript_3416:360-875(+)
MTTTNTPKPTDNGSNADNTNASDIDDTNTTSEAALESSRSHSTAVRPQERQGSIFLHDDGVFDHHANFVPSLPLSLPSFASSSSFFWPSLYGGIAESGPQHGNSTGTTTNSGGNRDHAIAAAVATEIVSLDDGSPSRHAHAPRGASLLEIIDDVLETLDGMDDNDEESYQH